MWCSTCISSEPTPSSKYCSSSRGADPTAAMNGWMAVYRCTHRERRAARTPGRPRRRTCRQRTCRSNTLPARARRRCCGGQSVKCTPWCILKSSAGLETVEHGGNVSVLRLISVSSCHDAGQSTGRVCRSASHARCAAGPGTCAARWSARTSSSCSGTARSTRGAGGVSGASSASAAAMVTEEAAEGASSEMTVTAGLASRGAAAGEQRGGVQQRSRPGDAGWSACSASSRSSEGSSAVLRRCGAGELGEVGCAAQRDGHPRRARNRLTN